VSVEVLGACATEDSTGCFWDATVHGTGFGQSFFEYDGVTVSVYVPKGFFIESVQVDGEHFFEAGYTHGAGYGVTFGQADEPAPTPAPTVVSTATPGPSVGSLPATGLDMTLPVLLVGFAVLCAVVGVPLAFWKRQKS
jgi:hypothetical protein